MNNIWILNHYASFECRHTFFSRELGARGYTVTLFASSFMHNNYIDLKKYENGQFAIKESDEGGYQRVWIKTVPYHSNNYMRFLNQVVFAYNCYRAGISVTENQPDIIIGSSVHLFTGLAAYYLARKKKVPFIFEVRDLWPQTLIDLGALKEWNPLTVVLRRLEKFLYQKADWIISVLPKGDEYIASLGVDKGKIVHIPNGIRLSWFDENVKNAGISLEVDKLFDSYKDKIVFTYLGAMGIANGLQTIVEAAKYIKEVKPNLAGKIIFLMAGDGPEREKLQGIAEKFNIRGICFVGFVEKKLVPYILSNSDVCMFHLKDTPVFRYGVSSNKLFDYLAAGKPLIYAADSEFDFIGAANCGIAVPPEDPIRFAEAVAELTAKSEGERQSLGKNAREYVEKNHEFGYLTSRLIKIFESYS